MQVFASIVKSLDRICVASIDHSIVDKCYYLVYYSRKFDTVAKVKPNKMEILILWTCFSYKLVIQIIIIKFNEPCAYVLELHFVFINKF